MTEKNHTIDMNRKSHNYYKHHTHKTTYMELNHNEQKKRQQKSNNQQKLTLIYKRHKQKNDKNYDKK